MIKDELEQLVLDNNRLFSFKEQRRIYYIIYVYNWTNEKKEVELRKLLKQKDH